MSEYNEAPWPDWISKLHTIHYRDKDWENRLLYLESAIERLKRLGDTVLGFNCFERIEFPDGFYSGDFKSKDATISIPIKASAVLPWAEAYLAEQKELASKRPDVLAKVKELAESIE